MAVPKCIYRLLHYAFEHFYIGYTCFGGRCRRHGQWLIS